MGTSVCPNKEPAMLRDKGSTEVEEGIFREISLVPSAPLP
jgi:hypothetical protein